MNEYTNKSSSISRPTGEPSNIAPLPQRVTGSGGPPPVWLVGAGPGDAGLLTLKGRDVLEKADVVVFDRLIGEGLLRYAPPHAELIDVGKRGGCHPVSQRDIEQILIEKALEGKRVVRLKGGDPFLFGRGGEEMAALMERGIACELVPGVTSALAVPAYAGIPVTHRGYASSLHIITAHRMQDGPPINFGALARLEGTLVFLMGVSELPDICANLMAAGMDGKTPAAIVERGTTARQRRVLAPLEELARRAAALGIRTPAVTVVGRVVELSETLDWRAAQPLCGRRVLVTRSGKKGGRLTALLRERGAEVVEVPCIKTEPVEAPLPSLTGCAWLVFTSPTGVETFFERLRADRKDIREIGCAKVAAVGPATRDALEARGLRVDLVPSVYNGASLGEALVSLFAGSAPAGRVLLLRAERGAPELARVLRDAEISYDEAPLYRTVQIAGDADLNDIDAAAFACASSVKSFAKAYPSVRLRTVCIGEQTAQAARDAGFEAHVAKKATLEDLVDAVELAVSQ